MMGQGVLTRAEPFRPQVGGTVYDSLVAASSELWVFAYGSLMWSPCFRYTQARPANLSGYERRFCIWSWDARGTRATPGLVLGLARGQGCRGMVFRIADADRAQSLNDLWQREMDADVYIPTLVHVEIGRGVRVTALTFVANDQSQQYAGDLGLVHQREVIATAKGQYGRNRDYLDNTVDHCRRLGIRDPYLETLASHMNMNGQDA